MRFRRVLAVMPVMGALGAIPLVNPGLGADELAVYPVAGTPTASPTTQISFRGAAAPLVVLVSGSQSGNHNGHVVSHSDGNGDSCSGTAGPSGDTTAKVAVLRKKGTAAIDDGPAGSWDSFTGAAVVSD